MKKKTSPRILLIQAEAKRRFNKQKLSISSIYPSYSLGLLSAILKRENYEVNVIDSFFAFLISNQTDTLRVFKNFIKKNKFDYIGISVLTPFRGIAIEIASFAKKLNPDTKIIMGGPHVSLLKDLFFKEYVNVIDAIVIGEGELTLLEVLEAFEGKRNIIDVKGIAFKNAKNEIILNQSRKEISDLNILSFPNYDDQYKILSLKNFNILPIFTSRGCFHTCGFCSSPQLWKTLRFRSPYNVVEEIIYMKRKYGVKEIRIWDDIFGADKNHAVQIFKLIVQNKIKIKIGYINTRFDLVDEEILYWFKKAGGVGVFYGLESGSEKVLELMNKKISLEKIKSISKITKRENLLLGYFLIFGYPGENNEDIKKTFKLVKELQPDQVLCNKALIYPGTELFDIALRENRINYECFIKNEMIYFPYTKNKKIDKYLNTFCHQFNKKPFRTKYENIIYDYACLE